MLKFLGRGFVACMVTTVAAAPGYQGHGAESLSKATLEKFRARPLDSKLSARIQSILDVRAPGSGMLSPDNQKLYFNWRVTGSSQVWRIDGPQKFPVQMTGGEDRTTLVAITPDGKNLVISRDRKGEEYPGLYLQPAGGGPLKVIQHTAKVQTLFSFISEDGRYLFFTANDVKPDAYAIHRYELATGKNETIFSQDGLWSIADATRDAQRLLLDKAKSNVENEIFEYDIAAKTLKPVVGQNEADEFRAHYARDEKSFLVLTPKFGEFRRLYTFNGQDFQPLSPDLKADVANFGVDQKRERIYFEVNDQGYTRLHVLSAKDFKKIELPALPEADHVVAGSSSQDSRYQVLVVSTAQAPRQTFVWDTRKNNLQQWVLPSSPEIDTSKFARAELQTYPARDGTPIPMFVYRSEKCRQESCPVLVDFHGGPEAQSQPGFDLFAQMLLDEGFDYVLPNVRGSDGYGKSWINADNKEKRLRVITDIEDCALFIRKAWSKNGKVPKIGVMGGSYGGYSTLMAMTRFAGAYDAGVSTVGMANLLTFMQNTAPYRRALRVPEYGDPAHDRKAMVELSPITHVKKIKGPLMIIQGATDPRVPAGEAVQMYNVAKGKGVPVELIIFADEGHGAQKRENQVLSIGHTIRFFKEHLQK